MKLSFRFTPINTAGGFSNVDGTMTELDIVLLMTDIPAPIVIIPGEPENIELPLIIGTPTQGQTLTGTEGIWDGIGLTFTYQWRANGVDIVNANNLTYLLTGNEVGKTITFRVTAANAQGTVPATSLATSIVQPTIPVNITIPVITGTPEVGRTLSGSNGTWNGVNLAFAYQWLRDGVIIAGATNNTYLIQAIDELTQLTFRVTATNSAGSTPSTSNPTDEVLPVAPSNITVPVISGTVQDGQTLSSTDGTWSGSGLTFAYQWLSNGSNIVGATNNTLLLTATEVGKAIQCRVTATNAAGSSSALSNQTAGVLPKAPVNTAAPLIVGNPTENQTLTGTNGTWQGTVTNYAYQWLRNSVAIAGATTTIYVLKAIDVGTVITFRVVATNTGGSNTATSLGTTPIAPDLPLAPVNTTPPTISFGTPALGESVVVSDDGVWTGTGVNFTYQWFADAIPIVSATLSFYQLKAAEIGKVITCEVTGTNISGSDSALSNATPTVKDSAPANTVLPVITGSAIVGQTLNASTGTWNGSNIVFTYQWSSDNIDIGGATNSSFLLTAAQEGEVIRVRVFANNTNPISPVSVVSLPTATVVPIAPVNNTLPTISGLAQSGQLLTGTDGTWTGTGLTFARQWLSNGSPILGATNLTYLLTDTEIGRVIQFSVTATNAGGSTVATSLQTAAVAPIPGGFTAEYQAVLDHALLIGGVAPSLAVQELQNQFIVDLIASGVWAELDILYPFIGGLDEIFSLINWKSPGQFTITQVGALSIDRLGWRGFSNNAYLNTNWNPTASPGNFTVGEASMFVYQANIAMTSVTKAYMGAIDGDGPNTGRSFIQAETAANSRFDINGDGGTPAILDFPITSAVLFVHVQKTTSLRKAFVDGVEAISGSENPPRLTNLPIFIGAQNTEGTVGAPLNGGSISIAGAGGSLVGLEAALYTAWNAYRTSLPVI